MHSKMVIWEMFAAFKQGRLSLGQFHQFVSQEPIYGDLAKKYAKHVGNFKTVFANDLTLEWVEDNIFGLSLFGNDNYIILESEKLSKSIVQRFSDSLSQVDTSLILIGSKALELPEVFITTEITPPSFWQMDRLLEFFLNVCKVKTTPGARQAIIDAIEPSPAAFYQVAMTLQSFHADQMVDVEHVQQILEKNKLNKFEFATLLSQKRTGEFFQRLSTIKTDSKTLRSFFLFMQTHLFKIFDPTYADKKNKLSKYDKEILDAAKAWQPQEIDQALDEFRLLEQASKLDVNKLDSLIHSMVLKYHGPGFHK